MNVFQCEQKTHEKKITLIMKGSIDEYVKFPTLKPLQSQTLTIDLGGVTFINSSGIRHWMIWISDLAQKLPSTPVVLKRCPHIFINQANVVDKIIPSVSKVESFYVPYICESCNETASGFLEYKKDYEEFSDSYEKHVKLREVLCPRCKKAMEPDIDPKLYFSFLKR